MPFEFNDDLKQRKIELISEGYDAYILFGFEDYEDKLANELNKEFDYLLATPLYKMAHRSRNGYKYDVKEVMISGYIFLFVKKDYPINNIKSKFYYFKVLSRNNDEGKLYGSDLKYADWVLEVEGLISVSEAIQLNGKVKIIKGPLKDMEGSIVEYSKRNRNCCIEVDLLGRSLRTWLPFEWVDSDASNLKLRNR